MAEDRKITALKPRVRRQGVAHNLSAAQRDPGAEAPNAAVEPQENLLAAETPPAEVPRKPGRTSTSPKNSVQGGDDQVQLGVKISKDLRGRARAAFREAKYHERVPTFWQFVSQALEAEIQRVENKYNDGAPFDPEDEDLPRGRAL